MKCLNCSKDVSNLVYPAGTPIYVVQCGDDPDDVIGIVMPYCMNCLPTLVEDDEYDEEVIYDDGWRE